MGDGASMENDNSDAMPPLMPANSSHSDDDMPGLAGSQNDGSEEGAGEDLDWDPDHDEEYDEVCAL